MPELDLWLTNPKVYEYLTSKEGKAFKDYLYDELPLKEAALKLYTHYDSASACNPYLQNVTDILSLIAIDLSESRKQRKIVKFLVALRNLRYTAMRGFYLKHGTELKKSTSSSPVLFELQTSINKYTNYLDDNVLAPLLGSASIRPESNIQFINLHAFIARLSSANTCVVMVGGICSAIINDDEIRNNRVILNVAVSAAAQHMIYSASHVLMFQMERPDYHGGFFGWQKWKEGFEEAQTSTFIGACAKKDAKLAVAGMNEAELVWKRRHMPRRINKVDHIRSCIEGIGTKNGPVHGTKRSHDEAFLNAFV